LCTAFFFAAAAALAGSCLFSITDIYFFNRAIKFASCVFTPAWACAPAFASAWSFANAYA
jgi:hypothetical protein